MAGISEKTALEELPKVLESLLDVPASSLRPQPGSPFQGLDLEADFGPHVLAVEYKSSGDAASVARAIEQLKRYLDDEGDQRILPLVVVPYLGATARRLCLEAGVGCVDLSGNAEITAPGLRVLVEGKPNRFKRPGRPGTVFSPKSSRLVRWLLLHPSRAFTQRELAQTTGLDEGYVSKIVRRLLADGLVIRSESGAIQARDPLLLLEAWREEYQFSKHRIVKGHLPARSGEALMYSVADALAGPESLQYAVTGLAAAWLYARFAAFRTLMLYVPDPPGRLIHALGFQEEERGANVWLAVPNDEGVFAGSSVIDGVRAVSLVQAYLDLKAGLERSEEAAEELKERYTAQVRGGE